MAASAGSTGSADRQVIRGFGQHARTDPTRCVSWAASILVGDHACHSPDPWVVSSRWPSEDGEERLEFKLVGRQRGTSYVWFELSIKVKTSVSRYSLITILLGASVKLFPSSSARCLLRNRADPNRASARLDTPGGLS